MGLHSGFLLGRLTVSTCGIRGGRIQNGQLWTKKTAVSGRSKAEDSLQRLSVSLCRRPALEGWRVCADGAGDQCPKATVKTRAPLKRKGGSSFSTPFIPCVGYKPIGWCYYILGGSSFLQPTSQSPSYTPRAFLICTAFLLKSSWHITIKNHSRIQGVQTECVLDAGQDTTSAHTW